MLIHCAASTALWDQQRNVEEDFPFLGQCLADASLIGYRSLVCHQNEMLAALNPVSLLERELTLAAGRLFCSLLKEDPFSLSRRMKLELSRLKDFSCAHVILTDSSSGKDCFPFLEKLRPLVEITQDEGITLHYHAPFSQNELILSLLDAFPSLGYVADIAHVDLPFESLITRLRYGFFRQCYESGRYTVLGDPDVEASSLPPLVFQEIAQKEYPFYCIVEALPWNKRSFPFAKLGYHALQTLIQQQAFLSVRAKL